MECQEQCCSNQPIQSYSEVLLGREKYLLRCCHLLDSPDELISVDGLEQIFLNVLFNLLKHRVNRGYYDDRPVVRVS
jgi:hypothetical protein